MKDLFITWVLVMLALSGGFALGKWDSQRQMDECWNAPVLHGASNPPSHMWICDLRKLRKCGKDETP